MYSFQGHPATWNDKTTVLYDNLIRGVHEGEILSDFEFELSCMSILLSQIIIHYTNYTHDIDTLTESGVW